MSDSWIVLIPADPYYIPDEEQCRRVRDRFEEIAPHNDGIEIKIGENIQFFDCAANFERIICPTCHKEISIDWWQDRLDDDALGDGFKLAQYSTPCCNAKHNLNELIYDWHQGFARFALEVMNPDIANLEEFSDRYKTEFEEILGTRICIICRRI